MAEPVLVLHTTESDSFAATHRFFLANPGRQPHIMIDPATGNRVDYIALHLPAKALRNLPGGVETNRRGGVVQVEIVGRAAEVAGKSDEWFRSLARSLTGICTDAGVPVRFPRPFVAYPASYGMRARQRLTGPEWLEVSGIIGHQHVPENDHGDPGDLNRLPDFMEELTMPDRTTIVRQMQEDLNTWGAGLTVDGDPGPLTAAALRAVLGEAVRIKNHNSVLLGELIEERKQHQAAEAEVARLTGLDTVARQGPAILALVQAARAELNRVADELVAIGGKG